MVFVFCSFYVFGFSVIFFVFGKCFYYFGVYYEFLVFVVFFIFRDSLELVVYF